MLRLAGNLLKGVQKCASIYNKVSLNSNFLINSLHPNKIKNDIVFKIPSRNINVLSATHHWEYTALFSTKNLIVRSNEFLTPKVVHNNIDQKRNITKYSLRSGKRRSNKAVTKRFFRLNWGMWIRTKASRHRRHWLKTAGRKTRSRWHVMTTAVQSHMLDKMTTNYWKRPKYYIDDPYEPYHSREEFHLTRRKPRPLD